MLGELFEGHALRDLLVDAIRYGDRPEKKAELFRKVDGAVDVDAIEKLVAERKLISEGMDPHAVSVIREEMERAQARRLQPHFIGAFFREAFTLLGGRIAEREKGRFEILRVPSILKERDRLIGRGDPGLPLRRPSWLASRRPNWLPLVTLSSKPRLMSFLNGFSHCSARAVCWSMRLMRALNRVSLYI